MSNLKYAQVINATSCPICGALEGAQCQNPDGTTRLREGSPTSHVSRLFMAQHLAGNRPKPTVTPKMIKTEKAKDERKQLNKAGSGGKSKGRKSRSNQNHLKEKLMMAQAELEQWKSKYYAAMDENASLRRKLSDARSGVRNSPRIEKMIAGLKEAAQ